MPVRRRVEKRRTSLDQYHVLQATCGTNYFRANGRGFDESAPDYQERLETAWPDLRAAALERCRELRDAGCGSCLLPKMWWRLEAPEPRDESLSEADQLKRLKIDPDAVE